MAQFVESRMPYAEATTCRLLMDSAASPGCDLFECNMLVNRRMITYTLAVKSAAI